MPGLEGAEPVHVEAVFVEPGGCHLIQVPQHLKPVVVFGEDVVLDNARLEPRPAARWLALPFLWPAQIDDRRQAHVGHPR